MLTIVLKDLYENHRTWLVFAVAGAAVLLLSEFVDLTDEKRGNIFGFIYGIIVASALIFTHSVVVNERKNRHLILLKSLPVSDARIIGAKITSLLILTLTLVNLPFLYHWIRGSSLELPGWIVSNSIVASYATLLFLVGLRFRNQAALFLPLYVMLALLILLTSSIPEAVGLPQMLLSQWIVSGLSLLLAFCFAIWSVRVFSRKELDL